MAILVIGNANLVCITFTVADWSKLRALADDRLDVAPKMVENITEKGKLLISTLLSSFPNDKIIDLSN